MSEVWKKSKRENNIYLFIAISENDWTRDKAGTKIMSVGCLCYFNKLSFYYMLDLENFEINDPSINELWQV